MDYQVKMLEAFFYLVLFLITPVTAYYAKYRRKRPRVLLEQTPILLGYYTHGKQILPIKEGNFGEYHYSALAALAFKVEPGTSSGPALIYRVELPFATKIHLLGIPTIEGIDQIKPQQGIMDKVSLEGNYDKYFSLYSETGMQSEARYVLDPMAMVFTIDFCRSHSWEIVGNELYFVQAGNRQAEDDPTFMGQDIEKFVIEIKPALAKQLTEKQKDILTPYGVDRRQDLKCPVCNAVMENRKDYFICLAKHGVLLQGRQLVKVRKGDITLPTGKSDEGIERAKQINCPSCGTLMSHVLFSNAHTTIDSCPNCPYRWLDGADKVQIIQS